MSSRPWQRWEDEVVCSRRGTGGVLAALRARGSVRTSASITSRRDWKCDYLQGRQRREHVVLLGNLSVATLR